MVGRKRARDEEEGGGPECGNGHPLVLVPREVREEGGSSGDRPQVRRLEKDYVWSCDGPGCQTEGEGAFPEKARYRCVHYGDGGNCNRDLCGDCLGAGPVASPESGVRRSGRESRPSALRAGEEWEVGERSPQGKLVRRSGGTSTTPPSPLKSADISPGEAARGALPDPPCKAAWAAAAGSARPGSCLRRRSWRPRRPVAAG
jgi:hypothetical protein